MLGLKMFIIFMAGTSSYGGPPNTPIPKIWAFIVGDGDMMGDSLGREATQRDIAIGLLISTTLE